MHVRGPTAVARVIIMLIICVLRSWFIGLVQEIVNPQYECIVVDSMLSSTQILQTTMN